MQKMYKNKNRSTKTQNREDFVPQYVRSGLEPIPLNPGRTNQSPEALQRQAQQRQKELAVQGAQRPQQPQQPQASKPQWSGQQSLQRQPEYNSGSSDSYLPGRRSSVPDEFVHGSRMVNSGKTEDILWNKTPTYIDPEPEHNHEMGDLVHSESPEDIEFDISSLAVGVVVIFYENEPVFQGYEEEAVKWLLEAVEDNEGLSADDFDIIKKVSLVNRLVLE